MAKQASASLDQLYEERQELRSRLGWGTWRFQNPHPAKELLKKVEDEIETRVFGKVLLY